MRRYEVLSGRRPSIALALIVVASGCESLLGVDEAHVDPALSARAGSAPVGGLTASGASAGRETSGGGSTSAGAPPSAGKTSSLGGAAGVPAEDSPSLCDDYCSSVMAHCDSVEDELLQYANLEQCSTVCALIPPGEDGDRNVNTVSCRARQARLAEYEPLTSCPLAGPAGMDSCGSTCEAYCGLMMQVCTEQTTVGLAGHYYYADLEACMGECSGLPAPETFWFDATWFSGNTIECRFYHLIVATEDGVEHCEHAVGRSICVD